MRGVPVRLRFGGWTHRRLAVAALAGLLFAGTSPAGVSVAAGDRMVITDSGYTMERLVGPNPLMKSTGMVIDGDGGFLYSADTLRNTIFRVDLDTFAVDPIAHDFEPVAQQLISPHTLEIDAAGRLYVTEWAPQTVRRIDRDGDGPRPLIAAGTGTSVRDEECRCDVSTGTTGIAFNSDGDLFVGDSTHDNRIEGGIWKVDPNGILPAQEVIRAPWMVEDISFRPDEPDVAYVSDVYGGAIRVLNVDTKQVVGSLGGFDRPWGNEYDSFQDRDRLLVTEMEGNLWELHPATGERRLLASIDRPGLKPG